MSIVIDSSVLVAALVDTGKSGSWAESLLGTDELVAPELVLVETTNALRRLEARRLISATEARNSLDDMLALDLERYPFAPFAARIWELRGAVSSYAAWYVALAEALRSPLATLDAPLTKASGPRCRFLMP